MISLEEHRHFSLSQKASEFLALVENLPSMISPGSRLHWNAMRVFRKLAIRHTSDSLIAKLSQ